MPPVDLDEAKSATPGRAWTKYLTVIGPAFIAGAWQFGPGNLTSAVQAGGKFQYSLIWVILVSTILMIFYTDMSVRIALNSEGSLIDSVKRTLGKPVGVLAGVGVFLITLMFSVGNAVGSGLGLSLIFGGSTVMWTLICTLVVASVMLFKNTYSVVEKILVSLVVMMAIGFILSAFLIKPDWGSAAQGLLPTFPAGVGLLLVALIGTNFSINAAFCTGYATRQRGLKQWQYKHIVIGDTIPGIVAPGIMTALVIIVAAAATQLTGEAPGSLAQLANIFRPAAGDIGYYIFSLGFFGAAFSSMVANSSNGGMLLADGLGWGNNLSEKRVKILVYAVLAFGAVVAAVFGGKSPVQLIVVANALTVLVAPILGVLLIVLSNNKKLMGTMVNTWWQNVMVGIGLAAILATCYRLIIVLLG